MTRSKASRARNAARWPYRRVCERVAFSDKVIELLECGHQKCIPTTSFAYEPQTHRRCRKCER